MMRKEIFEMSLTQNEIFALLEQDAEVYYKVEYEFGRSSMTAYEKFIMNDKYNSETARKIGDSDFFYYEDCPICLKYAFIEQDDFAEDDHYKMQDKLEKNHRIEVFVIVKTPTFIDSFEKILPYATNFKGMESD